MKVCIVGWYGTETLGDRAIFDGILAVLNHYCKKCEIFLGSLYPFFTERTIFEDGSYYKETAPTCTIKIFDERSHELHDIVEISDIVMMGGGPIMDLEELKIIREAFKYARRKGKKTVLMGCGLGPLNECLYKKVTENILELADTIIWRDELSARLCKELFADKFEFSVLEDPAIISALLYREQKSIENQKYLVINLRKFPVEYGGFNGLTKQKLQELFKMATNYFPQVYLVPMHTFFIGGDDRAFFAEIMESKKIRGVDILNKPLRLTNLYDLYSAAKAGIGMRYHSVVLQSILNGNNYILDYTNPVSGKISGYLFGENRRAFYLDRYYNMQTNKEFSIDQCMKVLLKESSYKYISDYDIIIENYCKCLFG